MSRPAPLQRFLGVDPNAPPYVLLGLPEPTRDRSVVETALRTQLERIFRHPGAQTPAADQARRQLRAAAAAMSAPPAAPSPRRSRERPAPPPAPKLGREARQLAASRKLTEFDRLVWAILVSHGGWNAQSRALLVGMASAHGVTADGLARVIVGLNDYARAGGSHEPFVPVQMPGPGDATGAPTAPILTPAQEQRLRDNIDLDTGESSGSTIRMSLFFGLLTIFVGIVIGRMVLRDGPPEAPPVASTPPPVEERAPITPPPTPAATSAVATLRFDRMPTFLGNALPPAATEAADHAVTVPAALDEVVRKLSITSEPAEAVYRAWDDALATIEMGWVLVEPSVRREVVRHVVDGMYEAASTPSVVDRLLAPLLPPTGRLGEPLDLWRGAWRAGLLGAVRAEATLPATVAERIDAQLGVAFDGVPVVETDADPFDALALAWLERTIDPLVEMTALDVRFHDYWESWLTAVTEIGTGEPRERLLGVVVCQVMATSTDLDREGPMVDVVGRFLTVADFEQSAATRDWVAGAFDDPAVATGDLWVLTSLLARSGMVAWFDETLVLPPDGSPSFRARARDRITARWPALASDAPALATGRGLDVDPAAVARWRGLFEVLDDAAEARDESEMMAVLLAWSQVNEAAALLAAYRVEQSEAVMATIGSSTASGPAPGPMTPNFRTGGGGAGGRGGAPGAPGASGRAGRVMGADGEWAELYDAVRRNTAEKLKWLRGLRTSAGSDLGPIDAEMFVREAYRGTPQEVRSLAAAVLIQQFGRGPNVGMEMLDQLPDAPRRSEAVEDLIQRLTGEVLPPLDDPEWARFARRALVEHALSLRPRGESPIDALADGLTRSVAGRAAALRRNGADLGIMEMPQDASARLADAWRQRIDAVIAVDPIPDDLDGLDRRRVSRRGLATGPIQAMVADQLSVLDAVVYLTVAEQPTRRAAAEAILDAAAVERSRATHVLAQAVEVERAIARLWALRLASADGGRS